MDQFLDPETDKKHQFLDPETDVFCQFLFWIQKLTLWISFWVQKLTLWARGTLCQIHLPGKSEFPKAWIVIFKLKNVHPSDKIQKEKLS